MHDPALEEFTLAQTHWIGLKKYFKGTPREMAPRGSDTWLPGKALSCITCLMRVIYLPEASITSSMEIIPTLLIPQVLLWRHMIKHSDKPFGKCL